MKKSNLLLLFLLITSFGWFVSCRKGNTENKIPVTEAIEKDEFFNVPSNAPEIIKLIAAKLSKQNKESRFADNMKMQSGNPSWENAIVITKDNAREQAERGNGKKKARGIVYIPFAKEAERKTNAILKVSLYDVDTVFAMIYPQQYQQYGFAAGNDTSWNARDLFNVFSNFDYKLFGTTRYIVYDARIFGIKNADTVLASVQWNDNNSFTTNTRIADKMASITVCNTVSLVCVYASTGPYEGGGSCPTTICTTYTFDDGTSSGSSSGSVAGGGGSSASNGSANTNPCAVTPPANMARSGERAADPGTSTSTPCGTIPWTPSEYDIDCNSFIYTQDRTANWQEAGVNQIRLSWVWDGPNHSATSRKVYIDHIVFGLPIIYSNGKTLSPGAAATVIAQIVQAVKIQTYLEFDNSPYYPTDYEVTKYFKEKLQLLMATQGGTAGATGSGNPRIVFKNEERSNWTNPYDCK